MRLVTKVMTGLVLATALLVASGDSGLAQYNCGFLTIEQCRANLTGGSSFCVPNQFYNPHGPAKRTRNRQEGGGTRLRDALRSLSVVLLLFGPRELRLLSDVSDCRKDRDENNRTRCYGRCACTRVDASQRGV